jgi:hypothetical protein
MREALKAHHAGRGMGARKVFELLDEDASGFLDQALMS